MVGNCSGVPPLSQQSFLSKLCKLGEEAGIITYVFSPHQLTNQLTNQRQSSSEYFPLVPFGFSVGIIGFTYQSETKNWVQHTYPLPDLIYDRAFFTSASQLQKHQNAVHLLLQLKQIPFLGRCLKGKWEVHQQLALNEQLYTFLPETEPLRKLSRIILWLKDMNRVILKPENGSHGKGLLYIEKMKKVFILKGRDGHNRILSESYSRPVQLLKRVAALIGSHRYLLQQYLNLLTEEGTAFDVRALMQKDGRGLWSLTGMAVRLAPPGSITANLHGGGTAEELTPFLNQQFGPLLAAEIIATLTRVASTIPTLLEQKFGRFAELGVDLGVDQAGKVWFIEANSKPGRALFYPAGKISFKLPGIYKPIAYAHYLLHHQFSRNKFGRVI